MDLKQYEQKKFALAEIIRSAQAVDSQDGTLIGGCRDLLSRLAEDRFNLMVVGRFSRGKSTLMNALLGGDHLPTGIVPLTSVITTVRYGSSPQVVLHFRDSGLNRQVPLTDLAEYVTQRGNPGNVKKIAWAEIQLPVDLLRRGLFFVDTPGLGSPIIENTLTTERFLPQADAFLLVTSYESPLSEEEDRMLERIRNSGKKLFVVMNKRDTVSPADREEADKFVRDRLGVILSEEFHDQYSISARQAQEAKLTSNPALLRDSGIESLESELMRFLLEDRAESFLRSMFERTSEFLARRSASSPASKRESWRAVEERLRIARQDITGRSTPASETQSSSAEGGYTLQIDRKTGCHICGAVVEAVFRFLSRYQYDLTIDPDTQRAHAERHGFCPFHTWQYEAISSPYGVCASYPTLVHRTAETLQELAAEAGDPASVQSLRRFPAAEQACSACQVRHAAEKQATSEVASLAGAQKALEGSVPACCLPHLAMVAGTLGPGEALRRLLLSHAVLLERTAEDLQRYALKHDALRRHLASDEERRASQVALLLLAGHRNVSSPWTVEYIL